MGIKSVNAENITSILKSGMTGVLTNTGTTGTGAECYMFAKRDNGTIFLKRFSTQSPTVSVHECIVPSGNTSFKEDLYKGKIYKVPIEGSASDLLIELCINDLEVDLDVFNKILSGMDYSEWSLTSTKSISLKFDKNSIKANVENDIQALNFYKRLWLPLDQQRKKFLNERIYSDLMNGVNEPGVKSFPSITYRYVTKLDNGNTEYILVNFAQNHNEPPEEFRDVEDYNSYIRMNIVKSTFDANGEYISSFFNYFPMVLKKVDDGIIINPKYDELSIRTYLGIDKLMDNEDYLDDSKDFYEKNVDLRYSLDRLSDELSNITELAQEYFSGGRKLTETLANLMRRGNEVPLLTSDESINDIFSKLIKNEEITPEKRQQIERLFWGVVEILSEEQRQRNRTVSGLLELLSRLTVVDSIWDISILDFDEALF